MQLNKSESTTQPLRTPAAIRNQSDIFSLFCTLPAPSESMVRGWEFRREDEDAQDDHSVSFVEGGLQIDKGDIEVAVSSIVSELLDKELKIGDVIESRPGGDETILYV